MNAKTVLADLFCHKSAEQEEEARSKFVEMLEKNEDIAQAVCSHNIPALISIILQSNSLREKKFADKYRYVAQLYQEKAVDAKKYIDEVLMRYPSDVIPYLTAEWIDAFCVEFDDTHAISDYLQNKINKNKSEIEKRKKRKSDIEATKATEDSSEAGTNKGVKEGASSKNIKKSSQKLQDEIDLYERENMSLEKLLESAKRWSKKSEGIKGCLQDAKSEIEKRIVEMYGDTAVNKEIVVAHEEETTRREEATCQEEAMRREMERLAAENDEMRKCISNISSKRASLEEKNSEYERRITNLTDTKKQLEEDLAQKKAKLEKAQNDVKDLEVLREEYEKILKQLNGTLIGALQAPISSIEETIYNINSKSCKRTRTQIARAIADDIDVLRKNFEEINLNPSSSKRLPIKCGICIASCVPFDVWINKSAIKYDQDKHHNDGGKADRVIAMTRGFSYVDNINVGRVIKAETETSVEKE